MRPALILLLVAALSSCGDARDGVDPADAGTPSECADQAAVDLGAATLRAPAYVTVTAGEVRLEVSDLMTTVLGEVTETAVYLGPAAEPVQPDPAHPERPAGAVTRVVVGVDEPAVVELAAGRYWLVSARSATLRVTGCAGVELSGVQPAEPDPGEVFGTSESSTE